MQSMPYSLSAFAAALLAVAMPLSITTPLAAQSPKDVIVLRDGTRQRNVEVLEMKLATVSFKKGAATESLPGAAIAQVLFDAAPDSYKLARGAYDKGDFAKAAELFMEASKAEARKPLQIDAHFHAGRSLAAASAKDPSRRESALTTLEGYLTENADGFHVPEARILVGRTLKLLGRTAEAETKLKEADEAASREGWSAIWQAMAKFELAELQSEAGRAAEARTAFQSVASLADGAAAQSPTDRAMLSDLRIRATVAQGETFIREKKYDDALRYYRGLAGGSGAAGEMNPLKAAALAGEGQAVFLSLKDPKAATSVPQIRQAQEMLARAGLLDATSSGTTAKSLYYQGLILLALGNERERDSKQRANMLFDSVVRYYPETRWAPLARAELDKR